MTQTISRERVFVVAAAGVNHNGSLDLAMQLVDAAADCGADAVKFQTFRAASLVAPDAVMADYQKRNLGGSDTQYSMLQRLELGVDDHAAIVEKCRARAIKFMSTAFDLDSLQMVVGCRPPVLKIPSGDVTAIPLVLATARMGIPIIMSTGMCNLAEIEIALGVVAFGLLGLTDQPGRDAFSRAFASSEGQDRLQEMVTLLHCVTDYPARPDEVNLRAMDTLAAAFGLDVGYSDHCLGTAVSLAAVARGARVIEKHITLDRALEGPDHLASLEPKEYGEMVAGIREIESSLGLRTKRPGSGEMLNRVVARRSLCAARPIFAGNPLTEADIAVQRPADGIEPIHFWDLIGRRVSRDYSAGERLEW